MKNVETAITISLFYDDRKAALKPEPKAVTETTPKFRDIHFLNITCDGATKKAGEIIGLPESPATDITLENVRITGAAGPFTQQDTQQPPLPECGRADRHAAPRTRHPLPDAPTPSMHPRPFIHDDFLLSTRTARRLYHEFAEPEPILDYHCRL